MEAKLALAWSWWLAVRPIVSEPTALGAVFHRSPATLASPTMVLACEVGLVGEAPFQAHEPLPVPRASRDGAVVVE
jgi:hypothetical protein